MIRKLTIFLIAVLVLTSACNTSTTKQDSDTLNIAATIVPIADAAKAVAGEHAEVNTIIPPGADPHSYDITSSELIQLQRASIIMGLGLEFERIEDRIIDSTGAEFVDVKKGIDLLDADPHDHGHDEEHEEIHEDHADEDHADEDHADEDHADEDHADEEHHDEHGDTHEDGVEHDMHEDEEDDHHDEHAADDHHDEHADDDHHDEDFKDPHVWLSPTNMIMVTDTIKDALVQADPANADAYEANAQSYIQRLQELDEEYKQRLAHCDQDVILVNHNAFSYMARDYGFTQLSISGTSPESEPSPREFVEIVEHAEEDNIKHVFYDVFLSKKAAESIASEVGADLLPLNTAVAPQQGDNYLSVMEHNLNQLAVGLECHDN